MDTVCLRKNRKLMNNNYKLMIMKIKFLLPALAGLAMVSCSQDEDFVNAEMQRGEFSPVTFSVSRENGADTREWMEDENGRWDNFTFVKGELLSLFNGATFGDDATVWTAIGQNAVFEGEGTGEELVFKTRSLVNPGKAIMVYPADTVFANTGSTLTLKISAVQTANTKDSIPYVSDVMNIAGIDETHGINANNTAGYGRQYDVILRPAASLFGMKIAPTETVDFAALGVKEIEFTKVEMKNGSTGLFTTEATVSPSTIASNLSTADAKKFGHFTKQADVTQVTDGDKVVASISTGDIKDNIAYFTLLPMADDAEADDGASIKVYTTYGSVTVGNDASAAATAKGPLQNVAESAGKNLKANLDDVIGKVWDVTKNSKFGSEKQGRVIRRSLCIDLSTLDMRGTFVKNSGQLIDILKVYDKLKIGEKYNKVNLILDGENGEFNLSGDALAALGKYNSAKKVKLDVATKTQKIVLNDADATLDKLKAETVIFVDGADGTKKVDVVLGGNVDWTLDQAYTNAKINGITSRGKLTYTNTTNATNELAYNLNVEGKMEIGSSKVALGMFRAEKTSEITVGEGKTVTFNGMTSLYGKVSNRGILSANAIVGNYGTIDNMFELSVLTGGKGAINNIGTIWNHGSLAVTFITKNGSDKYKGRIILTNKNDNVSVKYASYEGYIVYTLNQATNGVYNYEKAIGDVFNWLVVETEGTGATVNVKSSIKYLEIKGNAANVVTSVGGITVTDLFVNPSMRLLGANKLTATNIYVNDYILHSGNLVGNQQKVYNSGVHGEAKDATTYKSGQIRTVSNN